MNRDDRKTETKTINLFRGFISPKSMQIYEKWARGYFTIDEAVKEICRNTIDEIEEAERLAWLEIERTRT